MPRDTYRRQCLACFVRPPGLRLDNALRAAAPQQPWMVQRHFPLNNAPTCTPRKIGVQEHTAREKQKGKRVEIIADCADCRTRDLYSTPFQTPAESSETLFAVPQ